VGFAQFGVQISWLRLSCRERRQQNKEGDEEGAGFVGLRGLIGVLNLRLWRNVMRNLPYSG
jgi:hypothetical protein